MTESVRPSAVKTLLVFADGLFQSEIDGIADEGMAYRHLAQTGNVAVEKLEVEEAQVMSGIDSETCGEGYMGRLDEGSSSQASGSLG